MSILTSRIEEAKQSFSSEKKNNQKSFETKRDEYQLFSMASTKATPEHYAAWLKGYMKKNPKKKIIYDEAIFPHYGLRRFIILTQDAPIVPDEYNHSSPYDIIIPHGVTPTKITSHNVKIYYMDGFKTTAEEVYIFPKIEEILCP